MIYGYTRVSTDAQDLTSQLAQLKAAGCEKVFREKITGTTADRPQLQKLMKALAPGDVVITPAVDRLSRDTTDLLVIARNMQRAGAGIRSLAEPFLDTTSDFAEIIFAILGVAAKLERRRILERTARGRADAKEKGVKFGRKPILTPHQQKEARKRLETGETQRRRRAPSPPSARARPRARWRRKSKAVASRQGRAVVDRPADPVCQKCTDPHGCAGRRDSREHQGVGLDEPGAGGRGWWADRGPRQDTRRPAARHRRDPGDGGRGLERGAKAGLRAGRQSAGDHRQRVGPGAAAPRTRRVEAQRL